ncbi:HAMP domain-containing histidine kinase [Clostridiaceae bacterium OttesenSCG-928-D20]|nr:HAMP domain-containing histidine kinase [Clostridiaceae bacterium OttesenSCG-928-D20]
MNSVYHKSFLMSTGLVLSSFFLLGIVFVILGRGVLISERHENMTATSSEVARIASSYYDGSKSDTNPNGWRSMQLRTLLTTVSRVSGRHVFIADSDGLILSCSDRPGSCRHINHIIPSPSIDILKTEGSIRGVSDLGGILPGFFYVVSAPVYSSSSAEIIGYAFAVTESGLIIDTWQTFIFLFSLTALLIIFITAATSYISTKKLGKPLTEMTDVASHFAHGDFSARVKPYHETRNDELGDLVLAFNSMADSLERSERLKQEFLANVSHELKTPMTTIAGFADGILDGTIPPSLQDKYLETISSETKRLARLVRKMLDVSSISSQGSSEEKKKPFDLTETLRRTLISFEQSITNHSLDAKVLIPEEAIIIRGDEDAITQVVYNLLDNAVKFAEKGSSITLSLWKKDSCAFVSVKNKGETIPEEEIPIIFDRFQKIDSSRSKDPDGAGLGLYIAKSIIDNHGGSLGVTSKDNTTEFSFSLKLHQEKKTKLSGK